jgi:formate C-acetyltransferase
VLGDKIYKRGFLDFKREIENSVGSLDFENDPLALDKKEELTAISITAEGLLLYAQRYAEELRQLASKTQDSSRKQELLQLADICRRVPANKPNTFHEALQYYWFVHVGVITELNPWDSFNPGRLDVNLYPFYKEDLAAGRLNREEARELLQSFWIKFNNHPAPPKVGVTAEESSTYTDFTLINIGGLNRNGTNAVNELSYLILDVIEEMRLLQPGSMVQISSKNPDSLLKRAVKVIRTGFGQPSIFNSDAIIKEHLRQGKDLEDAREGGASGCVEAGVFGRESYILTGYFNLVKVMEVTLNSGVDLKTGREIGLKTLSCQKMKNFEEFYTEFERQLKYFIDLKIIGNNIIERLYAKNLPVPFLSLLIDDCIATGLDYHAGGARYNNNYLQGVGMGSGTDFLTSVKYNVFDQKTIGLRELLEALKNDFKDREILRQKLLNKTPKYGNDDDYADDLTIRLFNSFFKMVDGRSNVRGGHYRINLLPTTVHVYFGSVIGATPDGRKAYTPISEGISPVQGMDKKGILGVIKSAAKIDQVKTGGTLLNQKLTPALLEDEKGINSVVDLIRSYFRYDSHHIQFNVVTADTLRKAQKDPEKYKNLIVRVAGYSDYFRNLSSELQEEIIRRTEHQDF